MTDATLQPLPDGVLPVGVERADSRVVTTQLHKALTAFFVPLGLVHLHLFDMPAVITSARDSVHVPASKHGQGKAVDLRIFDKRPKWQPVYLLVLTTLGDRFGLTVFDESDLPGEAHIHVEVAE